MRTPSMIVLVRMSSLLMPNHANVVSRRPPRTVAFVPVSHCRLGCRLNAMLAALMLTSGVTGSTARLWLA
jgi:hypothetical protein